MYIYRLSRLLKSMYVYVFRLGEILLAFVATELILTIFINGFYFSEHEHLYP